jgi:hypothetical protein
LHLLSRQFRHQDTHLMFGNAGALFHGKRANSEDESTLSWPLFLCSLRTSEPWRRRARSRERRSWIVARGAPRVLVSLRVGAGLAGFEPATHGPGNRCGSPREPHYADSTAFSSPSRSNDTTPIDCQPEKSWWRRAPGDAKVKLVDTREIEWLPSPEGFPRASEAPQEPAEEPKGPPPAPGGTEAPAASEPPRRRSWWREFFGFGE